MSTNAIMLPVPANVHDALLMPLGAGKAAALGVGKKAALLDKAAARGLPVPSGYIMLDRVFELALDEGYLAVEGDAVTCADPTAFVAALNLPEFTGKKPTVTVASAFTMEDTPSLMQVGDLVAVEGVDPSKPAALVDALCAVWSASVGHETRRDVLIMQTLQAETSGVAFTGPNHEDDHIEADGEVSSLRKLRLFERGEREEGVARAEATWRDRLQVLLRRARDLYGDRNLSLAWADDGTTCYLLQARAVIVDVQRDELFTLANHREIFPALPSHYMTSVIASVGAELYGWYRQFDRDLPNGRPFVEVFAGRPYINQSLMIETMRALGLPTSIVTGSVGADESAADGLRWKRALAKLPALTQFGASQLNAAKSAEQTAKDFIALSQHVDGTLGQLGRTLREAYVQLVHANFALAQAITVGMGSLNEKQQAALFAATRTTNTELLTAVEPLRAYVADKPALRKQLLAGETPNDPEFQRQWGLLMTKYGHRGVYENDIAAPRYSESPALLFGMIAADTLPSVAKASGADELGPVAKRVRAAMMARPMLQDAAMRAFGAIRRAMVAHAEAAVESGQLPNVEALWLLTYEEAGMVDVGWQPGADFFTARQAERDELAALTMPQHMRRFDDLPTADAAPVTSDDKAFTAERGTSGKLKGKAWVLAEPSATLPDGYEANETVLVVQALNENWLPVLAQVGAVVVESASGYADGVLLLHELGLPAVVGLADAASIFADDEVLLVNADKLTVERKPI